MRTKIIALALAGGLSVSGCANMTPEEQAGAFLLGLVTVGAIGLAADGFDGGGGGTAYSSPGFNCTTIDLGGGLSSTSCN